MILVWALLSCHGPNIDSVESLEVLTEAGPDREVVVGEDVEFHASIPERAAAVWYFGDGSKADGARVTHVYQQPGHFTVTLEVSFEDGTRHVDALQLLAYRASATNPSVSSSAMAVSGDSVWVVVPEAGQVSHISRGELVDEISVCERPRSVFILDRLGAVTCELASTMVLFDVESGQIVSEYSFPAGARPHGVVGREETWWVTLEGLDSVAVVEEEEIRVIEVGPSPRGIALDPFDGVWVTAFRNIDSARLMRLDGEDVMLQMATTPDNDTGHRGIPNLMEQLVISPDGGTAYLGAVLQNIERGEFLDGQPLTFETTLRGLLSVVRLNETPAETHQKQFDNQGRAHSLAMSPRGDWIYVSHPGTRTIHRLDAYTLAVTGSILNAGFGVNGIRVSEDGTVLYVHSWLSREVRSYSTDAFQTNDDPIWVAPTLVDEPLEAEVLRGKVLFYDSFDTRVAKDGYLACAHCHPDGRDDAQIWDFTASGEGLRNTISLEGRGGLDMGPLHWSANFDEVQDFERQIRTHARGTGLVVDGDWPDEINPLDHRSTGLSADLDALSAFVHSLRQTPSSPYTGELSGELLFLDSGCGQCHRPPLYTDSSLETMVTHDIGSITEASGARLGEPLLGIDTPTLLGAWATAPYLHDGSAKTVEEAISAHAFVELSSSDLGLLADFVRSL